MTTQTTLSLRRALRAQTKTHKNMRVVIVAGNAPPELKGESYYHTTPSGKTRIQYPASYRWPMVYHASTRRIEVGEGFVAAYGFAHTR